MPWSTGISIPRRVSARPLTGFCKDWRAIRWALAKPVGKAYMEREPRFLLLTETGAGAARYSAPHGCLRFFFHSPDPSLQWAGAFCYLASDASNSTTARAISETMTKRLMAVLLFRLAPRRAQAVSEKKQPCGSSYSLLFPSTQCARKYGYRTSAQTKRKHPLGLSDSLPPLFRFAALTVYFIDLFHFSRKLEKYINWPLPGLISPCYTRFNPF